MVIVAAGMGADTASFGLETNGNRTLKADPGTLQTAVPHVFAAGDVVTGPTMITTAVGQGRRAAFMIDRYLQGLELDPDAFDEALPVVDKQQVLARQDVYDRREPLEPHAAMSAAPTDFRETEAPMTEEEAFLGAARCLDCGVCSECHACVDACPADAIKLDMREEDIDVGRRRRRAGHRLPAVPRRRQAGVRLRQVQERHHRHADGPSARPDAAVQLGRASGRRQGAGQHRLHHVHRLPRRPGRQPALLAHLLHVLRSSTTS